MFSFALNTCLSETDLGFPVFDYDIMLLLGLDGYLLLIFPLFIFLTVDGIKNFISNFFFSIFFSFFLFKDIFYIFLYYLFIWISVDMVRWNPEFLKVEYTLYHYFIAITIRYFVINRVMDMLKMEIRFIYVTKM